MIDAEWRRTRRIDGSWPTWYGEFYAKNAERGGRWLMGAVDSIGETERYAFSHRHERR